MLPTSLDLPDLIPPSTSSNPSCLRVLLLPAQLTTHNPLPPRLRIQMLNRMAVPAIPKQLLTSMWSITMVEAHLLRSSLVALVSQNSHPNTQAALMINSPPQVVPTILTLSTGDHDLVPPPVNPKQASSDYSISCNRLLGILALRGGYLTMDFPSIFGAFQVTLGLYQTLSSSCFPSFADAIMRLPLLHPPSQYIHHLYIYPIHSCEDFDICTV